MSGNFECDKYKPHLNVVIGSARRAENMIRCSVERMATETLIHFCHSLWNEEWWDQWYVFAYLMHTSIIHIYCHLNCLHASSCEFLSRFQSVISDIEFTEQNFTSIWIPVPQNSSRLKCNIWFVTTHLHATFTKRNIEKQNEREGKMKI